MTEDGLQVSLCRSVRVQVSLCRSVCVGQFVPWMSCFRERSLSIHAPAGT
jgi:hypothetical protein